MKSANEQREELILLICEVLRALAEQRPSFTAQTFIDRAVALARFGNYDKAIEYIKIARSYVQPEKVTV